MPLSKSTFKKLIDSKLSISVAESCTGGLLSNNFTKNSGASKIFNMGLITYSNASKQKILNVPDNIINKYGSVSKQTALSMLSNLYRISKSDICIITTGIAGPNGGTSIKPIGLVFVGIRYKNNKLIFKKKFKGSRISIQKQTADFIFLKINKLL